MTHYTEASIVEALGTEAADWQWDVGCIKTELVFKDFKTAFDFMSKVRESILEHRFVQFRKDFYNRWVDYRPKDL